MIGNALKKIFGTKSGRDIKVIMPYVEKTNEEYSIFILTITISVDSNE